MFPDQPEQCLSWLVLGFLGSKQVVQQILRKEASKKVKQQAGRGRLVVRILIPYMLLFSGHLQSCTGDIRAAPVLQVGKAIPDKGIGFITAES